MEYKAFQKIKNLRPIARNEIILDCDNRKLGDLGIRRIGMMFSYGGYKIEIYRADGQKSYHGHIKNIPHIAELPKEQNKLYKELLIKKYIAKVRELIEATELDDIDFSLCVPDHLVAEECKRHFKYRTIKNLVAVINPNHTNFCDRDIYEQATQLETYKPQVTGTGITAQIAQRISIVDIARQFGLDIKGNKTLCPFHPDNNTPSLVFYKEQGRFYCFGCQTNGNIIYFYALLKKLNPNFQYQK